uniref:atlastin-1-like n=1 Tax=Styela clava TaxID=7725 RepID=UPI001939A75F|nr:atlastin-1-like [Styela clava]
MATCMEKDEFYEDEGEAIPIYVKDENGKQIFLKDNVLRILNQKGVKDGKVMVLTVAGAMREGKSFILNLFIKYLESGMSSSWLDGDENNTLAGFSWRGGTKSNTMGILMWSKPYFANLYGKNKVN